MDADGSDPRNLTNHSANELAPSWSPDGLSIAFESSRDGNKEIWVMDADGDNHRQLTYLDEGVLPSCMVSGWSFNRLRHQKGRQQS